MSDFRLMDDSMELDDAGNNVLESNVVCTLFRGRGGDKSLDEVSCNERKSEGRFLIDLKEPLPREDLNSSFDITMLQSNRVSLDECPEPLRITASWDENESSTSCILQHIPHGDTPKSRIKATTLFGHELPPTSSSRSNSIRKVLEPSTPLVSRLRQSTMKKSVGKLTPATAKRHKAPLHLARRSSPAHIHTTRLSPAQIHSSSLSATPAIHDYNIRAFGRTPWNNQKHPDKLDFSGKQCGNHSDNLFDPLDATPLVGNKRPPKRSLGTTTTATVSSSLLETTNDTIDSTDTHESSTPFRFTSFPASLPRIHNNPDSASLLSCPGTIRKRMSFGNVLNQSREDEGTHNTSVSSIHDDNCGYSDDDSTESPHVTRTRLDFNSVKSPLALTSNLEDEDDHDLVLHDADDRFDLSRPYEQTRMNSFASSVSSLTKNLSSYDDNNLAHPTLCLSPTRFVCTREPDALQPRTPNEVRIHFQLDAAQCSPIQGIPEEDGEVSSKSGVCISKKQRKNRTLSASQQSSSASSSNSSRPLPEMGAFEPIQGSPNREASSKGSGSTKSYPPSPKLLCPPTPVRTPAWAQLSIGGKVWAQNKILRSNSLIATKILATCPQPIDKHDLLEGSYVLEEAPSSDGIDGSFLHSDDDTIVQDSNRIPVTSVPSTINNVELGDKDTVPPVSLATSFAILSTLGKGNFADVFRVRSKIDGRLYAVKRNRRRFRGRRDRDAAMSEVRCMQRLQARYEHSCDKETDYSIYLLSFVQAWQEDGHFFCQTELCCRDTCRDMMDSLRSNFPTAKLLYPIINRLAQTQVNTNNDIQGCLMPEEVIWKVCHDICAGLSHIHANNLVHNDIKPSNILFCRHRNFGALCKIGDFGMTRNAGSKEDGQEGDQKYMARELLQSGIATPSGDIFSLGLTLYEMASTLSFSVPSDGPRWHELRSGQDKLEICDTRSSELIQMIQRMIAPDITQRPTATNVLALDKVRIASSSLCVFLRDYVQAVEDFDKKQEEKAQRALHFDQTPRTGTRQICSPPLVELPPNLISNLCSPDFAS